MLALLPTVIPAFGVSAMLIYGFFGRRDDPRWQRLVLGTVCAIWACIMPWLVFFFAVFRRQQLWCSVSEFARDTDGQNVGLPWGADMTLLPGFLFPHLMRGWQYRWRRRRTLVGRAAGVLWMGTVLFMLAFGEFHGLVQSELLIAMGLVMEVVAVATWRYQAVRLGAPISPRRPVFRRAWPWLLLYLFGTGLILWAFAA